jgi:hypothetical protein
MVERDMLAMRWSNRSGLGSRRVHIDVSMLEESFEDCMVHLLLEPLPLQNVFV